jgi:hypothetical protein
LNSKPYAIIVGMIITLSMITTTILYFQDVTATSNSNTTTLSSPMIPTGCKSSDDLPDRKCTPGAINGNVTQDNINDTICFPGFAKKIRPPTSYTTPLEIKLMKSYGFTGDRKDFELDHLISLQLGGSPKDVKNLWPEPYLTEFNAHTKDRFENYLHKQICNGSMSLSEAQEQIATDWKTNCKQVHKC